MTEQQPAAEEHVYAADYERLASGPLVSTLESWRGPALPLSLSEADLDLLDLVLCVYPNSGLSRTWDKWRGHTG